MENVVPNGLQRLCAADIVRMAGLAAASVGQEYYRSGAVHSVSRRGAILIGIVERLPIAMGRHEPAPPDALLSQANGDTSAKMVQQRFPVEVEFVENGQKIVGTGVEAVGAGLVPAQTQQPSAFSWRSKCACRFGEREQGQAQQGLCAHGAALLYKWLAQPLLFQAEQSETETQSEGDRVKSTRKNEGSDVTNSENKGTGDVGIRASLKMGQANFAPAEEPMESPIQRHSVGLAPAESLHTILSQLSLSELRASAREYGLAISGVGRQQLADAILAQLRKPDVVRRVAATLEKSQRQFLAALILAGGVVSDDDLRGLFERFSLGQPSQLQQVLQTLQSKALLFRISLNASNVAHRSNHALSNSALLDIGWYVPWDVCSALRVLVPVTPFDVKNVVEQEKNKIGSRQAAITLAEPSGPLAMVLLVARLLEGYTPNAEETWHQRDEVKRPEMTWSRLGTYSKSGMSVSDLQSTDGSVALPSPEDLPPSSLLQELQKRILHIKEGMLHASEPAFLRFLIRVLGVADLFQKGEGQPPTLRLQSGTVERLLGADWPKTLRTLFKRWLILASYGDLYDLSEEQLRLRCRGYGGQPVLRFSEFDSEHSQARQNIAGLLAQAPRNQWVNFSAFARFVYRLNPLFLQRGQQGSVAMANYMAPQWWLELEEGRPLRPSQLHDWLRAEYAYLRRVIAGPLHWWGACDIVTSADGQLLAFRLTPMAGWLFNGTPVRSLQLEEKLQEEDDYQGYIAALDVVDANQEQEIVKDGREAVDSGQGQALPLLLVACSVQNWPMIQLLEMFTQVASVQRGLLAYRVSAQAFGQALGRGLRPFSLLRLLRLAAEVNAASNATQAELFTRIATQLEQWLGGYSRVRLYTGVTLLETVDVAVMREVVATTSLEESLVQNIHPTLCVVKPHMIGHIVDELKQRGQSPLLHEEDL